jgi:hypothetical protein
MIHWLTPLGKDDFYRQGADVRFQAHALIRRRVAYQGVFDVRRAPDSVAIADLTRGSDWANAEVDGG